MNLMNDEKVFCITKEAAEAAGVVAYREGTTDDTQRESVLSNLTQCIATVDYNPDSYVPRSACETDEGLLQVIPYVVYTQTSPLTNKIVKVLGYRRGGAGDVRLTTKRSIGFGGHINLEDSEAVNKGYMSGLIREQVEELGISEELQKSSAFVLRDYIFIPGANQVSRVHLGMLHTCEVTPEQAALLTVPENESKSLVELRWLTSQLLDYLMQNNGADGDWEAWSVNAWDKIKPNNGLMF